MFSLIINALNIKAAIGATAVAVIALAFPLYEASHAKVVELDKTVNTQQMRIAKECAKLGGLPHDARVEQLIAAECLDPEYLTREQVPAAIPRDAFENFAAQADELNAVEAAELLSTEERIAELEAAELAAREQLEAVRAELEAARSSV